MAKKKAKLDTFEIRVGKANIELKKLLDKYELSITGEFQYGTKQINAIMKFVDLRKEIKMSEENTQAEATGQAQETVAADQASDTSSEDSTASDEQSAKSAGEAE